MAMHARANVCTIMGHAPLLPVPAERAFKALHRRLIELDDERSLPAPDPAPGGRRVIVGSVARNGAVRTALLAPERFLVVGRHTRCGLYTGEDDEAVSLRHVVVRWHADPDTGAHRIHLWDLRAGAPMATEDGRTTRAVVADGPMFVALGGQGLWVLPFDGPIAPRDPDEAWRTLPPRSFGVVHAVTREAPNAPGSARRSTTITHHDAPLPFGQSLGQPPDGTAEANVAVELPGARTERWISGAQLDRGLLFGRYERCQLTLGDDQCLSRVHLFVVRIGGAVWAVDTASTNGTHHNGAPVDALPLGQASSLLLGRQCVVRWRVESGARA